MILVDGGGALSLAILQRLRDEGSEVGRVRLADGLSE